MIQVYASTSESPDEEIEKFYEILEDTLQKIPTRDVTIIIGDLNAKIGCTKDDDHLKNVVGKYGIGMRNGRGKRLLNFCTENNLTIANAVFQQHIRRLYT